VDLKAKLALAHQFIWSFPKSTLLPDAGKILSDLEQKKAAADEELANEKASRLQRENFLKAGVAARNLQIQDWREFLKNMSQDDVLFYLGPPKSKAADGTWYYGDNWTIDPGSAQRTGIVLFFNGTRVLNVSAGTEQ
jgi:hypothetical protein